MKKDSIRVGSLPVTAWTREQRLSHLLREIDGSRNVGLRDVPESLHCVLHCADLGFHEVSPAPEVAANVSGSFTNFFRQLPQQK